MKKIGYDKPLYVLPFDHRGSFETKMFGWHGEAATRSDRHSGLVMTRQKWLVAYTPEMLRFPPDVFTGIMP